MGVCCVIYFVVFSLLLVSVVSFSLSSGIIRAPLLYRMVNAGLSDYKKKKKITYR